MAVVWTQAPLESSVSTELTGNRLRLLHPVTQLGLAALARHQLCEHVVLSLHQFFFLLLLLHFQLFPPHGLLCFDIVCTPFAAFMIATWLILLLFNQLVAFHIVLVDTVHLSLFFQLSQVFSIDWLLFL